MSAFSQHFRGALRSSLVLAFITIIGNSTPSYAAGEQSDETQPPAKTETTKDCKDGMVWDKKKKECVKPEESGFNDDDLYSAAREFAYAGQYDNAIRVLQLAHDQNDPRILNYLGYSNRKAGRMEIGMQFYRKALAIDANYILARSYMGQALIEEGKVAEAKMQLIEIRDRGGEDTWAYRALLQSLNGYNSY